MGISDLLAMLTGGGGGHGDVAPAAAMAPGDAPAVQGAPSGGVGAFLGDSDVGAPDQATATPYQVSAPAAPPAAPQPSTPPSDAGGGGLSDFLSRMVHKATDRNPTTGMSLLDRIGAVGGSMTDATGYTRGAESGAVQAGQERVATTLAAQKRIQLNKMADALGMSPRERLIFTADPEKWTAANAKNLEAATIPGGDTRVTPGNAPYTAPKVGQEGGEGYSVTPTGMSDLGGLAPSPQQHAQDDVRHAQQVAMDAYHQQMAQAARVRAAAETTRANRPPALGNGGSWLPPGAKIVGVGRPQ